MINWLSLLTVQLVSIGATLAVVVLVSLAVTGLSARHVDHDAPASISGRHPLTVSARSGAVVGVTSLVLAAAIVLFGLWQIVAR